MTLGTVPTVTVLVVDDDPKIRGFLVESLRIKGLRPIVAEDCARAKEVFDQHKPEVILLDLMMAGMNGWEYLDWLRESQRLTRTKVLIITAHDRPNDADLISRGAAGVFHKPALNGLFQAINRIRVDVTV